MLPPDVVPQSGSCWQNSSLTPPKRLMASRLRRSFQVMREASSVLASTPKNLAVDTRNMRFREYMETPLEAATTVPAAAEAAAVDDTGGGGEADEVADITTGAPAEDAAMADTGPGGPAAADGICSEDDPEAAAEDSVRCRCGVGDCCIWIWVWRPG